VIVNFHHETRYQDEKLYTMKAEEGFLCRIAFLRVLRVHNLEFSRKTGFRHSFLRVGQIVVVVWSGDIESHNCND
jgi:hypothetical protein